jgi:peptidyl-prolyl cis-trans isomerase C
MNLRRRPIALFLSALCLTAAGVAPQAAETAATAAATESSVLVAVNGEEITKDAFAVYFNQASRGKAPQALQGQTTALLNDMVNTVLLRQQAEKEGLLKQPGVEVYLQLMRDEYLSKLAINHYLEQHPISEEALKKVYDERYANGPGLEYRPRHILVASEAEAQGVIDQLAKQGDFAKLAAEKSSDASGKEGGELGWLTPEQVVPAFAEALVALKPGEYTKKPVQSPFGWHVIELQESRPAPQPPFDKLRGKLLNEQRSELLSQYIRGIREAAKVEIKATELIGEAKP